MICAIVIHGGSGSLEILGRGVSAYETYRDHCHWQFCCKCHKAHCRFNKKGNKKDRS